MIQRHGSVRAHHFAHKSGCECVPPREPMTQWHLDWQREFPTESREIVVRRGTEYCRSDVRLGRLTLEFQHSSISDSRWSVRTRFYRDAGDSVVWIYDRTSCDVRDDLDTVDGRSDAVWMGCETLRMREFARECSVGRGAGVVFLDYGDFVAMVWLLRDVTEFSCGATPACVALLTRSDFVALVSDWGSLPDDASVDFDVDAWVRDHDAWFRDALRRVLSSLGASSAVAWVNSRLDAFVVARSVSTSVLSSAGCLDVAYFDDGRSVFRRSLSSATLYSDVEQASLVASRAELACGSGVCCDVIRVDVVMAARCIVSLWRHVLECSVGDLGRRR